MLTPRRTGPRRPHRPGRGHGDAGVSLVELVATMVVLSVVLAVLASGLMLVLGAYGRVQDESLTADRGRVALDRLDRALRQASSVTFPHRTGTTWYLEYLTDLGVPPATCSQWRVDATAGTLSTRSWPDGGTVPSTWSTVATGVVNDPTTQPPFGLVPATATSPRQMVGVQLLLALPRGRAMTTATLTARNSSTSSPSNADTNGDQLSDSPVCAAPGEAYSAGARATTTASR